jgi:cytochrome c biogenesis protein CcmG/thiol:disulfide interchange protein DsbE
MMNQRIRWATLITAVALVAAACTSSGEATPDAAEASPASTPAQQQAGTPAPTTSFALFDGSTATFADYAGTPLVVNFWASWCPSCVAEMSAAFLPAQQRLGDQVAFVGLNIQDERSKAEELAAETGVLFDLAEDADGALYVELGGLGMPFTVFINADGEVVDEHNGPLTEGQLVDKIEEVLLG